LQVNKPLKVHILGTDTDVGKTWICKKLVQILNERDFSALPIKPIHSGWPKNENWGEDFIPHQPFLKNSTWSDLCAYRFVEPMSPHAAAKLENTEIKMERLKLFWESLAQFQEKILLIEGIGGVCCPLGPHLTYLDFLRENQAPCILVSKVGLGSLNHALMSEKLLRSCDLKVLGLILNPERAFDENDLIYQNAKWELEEQVSCPVYGPLQRDGELEPLEPLIEQICRGDFD
jgi:dethiobiotin synthetase